MIDVVLLSSDIRNAMLVYTEGPSSVKKEKFIIEGQVLWVSEDRPKGKHLIRLHLTDACHDDDFCELAKVCM